MFDIVTYDENLLNAEQDKIRGIYTQIGERFYTAHRDDAGEEYADLFGEVKACEKRMADHKAEVLLANGLILCPRCGAEIYYKSIFCNFCGIRIVPEEKPEPEPEPEPEPVIEEPVIEEPVIEEPVIEEPAFEEPVAEYPVTEEPVTEEPATEEPVTEETAAAAAEIFDPDLFGDEDNNETNQIQTKIFTPRDGQEEAYPLTEPAEEEPAPPEQKICGNCGSAVDFDSRFCVVCGAPLDMGPAPEPQPENVRYCKCGYKVTDSSAVFCNECGARLDSPFPQREPARAKKPVSKVCPFCGFTTTDPEVMFCIECGSRLS